jgi:hypothetical protein
MATIKRYESIEIQIPSGSILNRYYFNDYPNLRNSLIQNIYLFSDQAINPSVLTGGQPATIGDIQQTSITLYSGDQQLIYNCPLTSFIYQQTQNSAGAYPGNFFPLNFNGINISWTKSYISSPYVQDSNNVVYSFGVFYNF